MAAEHAHGLGAAGVAVFCDPSASPLVSDAVLDGPAPDRLGPSPCAALDFHAWKETAPADRDRANGAAKHKDGDVAMLAFKISRAENGQVGGGGNQRGCRAPEGKWRPLLLGVTDSVSLWH